VDCLARPAHDTVHDSADGENDFVFAIGVRAEVDFPSLVHLPLKADHIISAHEITDILIDFG
jgi:hypothetical protein